MRLRGIIGQVTDSEAALEGVTIIQLLVSPVALKRGNTCISNLKKKKTIAGEHESLLLMTLKTGICIADQKLAIYPVILSFRT